jgi:D-alanyl-D-alanine carboxypeptidase
VARHPDYEPAASQAALDAFLDLPPARRARDIATGVAHLEAAQQEYRERAGSDAGSRYKSFSPNGFRIFYDRIEQEGTGPEILEAPVTGDTAADLRITQIATRRGYRLRAVADERGLVWLGENRTHPKALQAYRELRGAARAEGITLDLVSGYRSLDHQRRIFVARLSESSRVLRGRDVSPEEIGQGRADDVVDEVLKTSAIPGYSKHHTGYAMDWIDTTSGMAFTDFERTPANRWLEAGNYENAKRFGFIPSYPPGASEQGPDPETWEFVWVGEDLLREEW